LAKICISLLDLHDDNKLKDILHSVHELFSQRCAKKCVMRNRHSGNGYFQHANYCFITCQPRVIYQHSNVQSVWTIQNWLSWLVHM